VAARGVLATLLVAALGGCGASTSTKPVAPAPAAGARPAAEEGLAVSRGTLVPARPVRTDLSALERETLPRIFAADSPWNEAVDVLPSAADSAALLALASQPAGGPASGGSGVYVNTTRWTDTLVTDQNGVATRVFCRQVQCGGDAVGLTSLSIPPRVSPDPRFDGWFTVFDTRRNVAYDLWRARRQADGSVSFEYVKKWNLAGSGYQPPYSTGVRGSGLPLFAGLITLADMRSGHIDHALAMSVPGPARGSFVSPASATDGDASPGSLPEGARLRLRPGFVLRGLPRGANRRVVGAILSALTKYGAIVVDRAAVATLYAQRDVAAAYLQGGELQDLHLRDFQVVALPQRIPFPNPQVGP
jgi:hypothetical protein